MPVCPNAAAADAVYSLISSESSSVIRAPAAALDRVPFAGVVQDFAHQPGADPEKVGQMAARRTHVSIDQDPLEQPANPARPNNGQRLAGYAELGTEEDLHNRARWLP